MSRKKHWNYEDDHDYDDSIDYKAKGMVYWYGKYYPKEDIDKLFPKDNSSKDLIALLVLGSIAAAAYGVKKFLDNFGITRGK